jgi:arylsulfatase A-like enzyme
MRPALVIALLILCTAQCAPEPFESPVHNVVVVIIDTLRADALGCYGNPNGPTPRIDAIAAEGVRFEQAISTSGWTLPAVGSLLTGTWPLVHGGLGKKTMLSPIRPELPTAAEVLRSAGFNTLAVANATFFSPALELDRGFDVFDHRNAFNRTIRRADESVRRALELIREHRDQSNFVVVHLFDPHLDYDPPPGFTTRFTGGRSDPPAPLRRAQCREMGAAEREYIEGVYLGEVAFVDTQVGVLVDELNAMGIYDRTTLVVTADHGEELWDHGGFEHGHTLYDELVHIPLIVKLPAGVEAAVRRVPAQVRILDIMPTVFDLVGVVPPESFVGASLLPLIRGEQGEDRVAYCESTLYGADRIALRTSRYKYIYDMDPEREDKAELYDWTADPGETENLVHSRPEIAGELAAQLGVLAADLTRRAKGMSKLRPAWLDPEEIESLRSLGYLD